MPWMRGPSASGSVDPCPTSLPCSRCRSLHPCIRTPRAWIRARQRSLPARRYVPGERIELERNPRYRDAAAVAIDGSAIQRRRPHDRAEPVSCRRPRPHQRSAEHPARLAAPRVPGELRLAPYLSSTLCAYMKRHPGRRVRRRSRWRSTGIASRAWLPAPANGRRRLGSRGHGALHARPIRVARPALPAGRGRGARALAGCASRGLGAGGAHAVHRRERQPPSHGRRAGRPVAHRARCRDRDRRAGVERLPGPRASTPATATWCGSAGRRTSSTRRPSRSCSSQATSQNTLGYRSAAYDGLVADRDSRPMPAGAWRCWPRRSSSCSRTRRHPGLLPRLEATGEALRRGLRREPAGPRRVAVPALNAA